jgi:hypothetical protein
VPGRLPNVTFATPFSRLSRLNRIVEQDEARMNPRCNQNGHRTMSSLHYYDMRGGGNALAQPRPLNVTFAK